VRHEPEQYGAIARLRVPPKADPKGDDERAPHSSAYEDDRKDDIKPFFSHAVTSLRSTAADIRQGRVLL
jgi:hypothetical protein